MPLHLSTTINHKSINSAANLHINTNNVENMMHNLKHTDQEQCILQLLPSATSNSSAYKPINLDPAKLHPNPSPLSVDPNEPAADHSANLLSLSLKLPELVDNHTTTNMDYDHIPSSNINPQHDHERYYNTNQKKSGAHKSSPNYSLDLKIALIGSDNY
jgi:hypothetical protein